MNNDGWTAGVDEMIALLASGDYLADRALATAITLALKLKRPLLLEGEAGVGKTEVANVLARCLSRRLIRLQCYDGLDIATALYEWNYPRQMLEIRLAEAERASRETIEAELFAERFLLRRPLLQALSPDPNGAPVLLIDELDRADEPFEAFLLELLADYQVTIPELGTLRAPRPPITVITSNRTREIHDALRRRCLYAWVDYPDAARELAIVRRKAAGASETLAQQAVAFVQTLRREPLFKLPGVAETIDWVNALVALGRLDLDAATIEETSGALLKYRDDIARLQGGEAARLLAAVREGASMS
jgi:MoxR-like ATPase